jgi:hypothetical protein
MPDAEKLSMREFSRFKEHHQVRAARERLPLAGSARQKTKRFIKRGWRF